MVSCCHLVLIRCTAYSHCWCLTKRWSVRIYTLHRILCSVVENGSMIERQEKPVYQIRIVRCLCGNVLRVTFVGLKPDWNLPGASWNILHAVLKCWTLFFSITYIDILKLKNFWRLEGTFEDSIFYFSFEKTAISPLFVITKVGCSTHAEIRKHPTRRPSLCLCHDPFPVTKVEGEIGVKHHVKNALKNTVEGEGVLKLKISGRSF